ncbi:MAG: hydrogenase [Candidatus Omnitrophica bacterium]|nr:hydrogenase [Candidatus Omnitrophota bacterium]
MTIWIDAACILVVFFSLSILAAYRIGGMIQMFAVQSLVLSFMPVLMHSHALSLRDILLSLGTMVLKAVLVPYILFWAIRHVSMRSEVKPIIGIGSSIVCGALLIAGSFWVSSSVTFPGKIASDLVIPCSLATVLLGFMIMVTRTRAVTQVVGYLVMENGIFLFALSLFDAMPILIEMGILLDIFAAVFIMAIVVNHINEEFERSPAAVKRWSKMGESI